MSGLDDDFQRVRKTECHGRADLQRKCFTIAAGRESSEMLFDLAPDRN
jgi:hypothetical protein